MADRDNDGIPDYLDTNDGSQGAGGTGNTPETNDADQKASPLDRLRILLNRRQRAIEGGARDALRDINKRIERILVNHPNNTKLWEEAEDSGFNVPDPPADERPVQGPGLGGRDPDAKYDDPNTPQDESKDGGRDGDGTKETKPKPNLKSQAKDNRLLGDLGKEFQLVRGEGGMFVAEYAYKVDGEVIRVGVKLGKDPDKLSRYGLKASDAKPRTKAQMKKIKSIGWADELAPNMRKGDTNVFKSLTRYLRNQYGGQAILENDEVMAVVIANSMFGWSAGEFENRLRNTSWYKNTNEWQRSWVTTMSPEEKRERKAQTLESVVNSLEANYGEKWMDHVPGGMQTAQRWADQISRGRWGEPSAGFDFWAERQFDAARAVEGTPAWIKWNQEQEADRAYMNRPEDMFETLRSQAMSYLGQVQGKPLIDRDTLMSWATDIVTEQRSDGDWQDYLRRQMRQLHPYFDENRSFTEQASPYKSIAESIVGTTLSWDDNLMLAIAGTDNEGRPTNQVRSLHDYAQYVRDNDPRFWANPQTEEKGRAFGQELLSIMGGV